MNLEDIPQSSLYKYFKNAYYNKKNARYYITNSWFNRKTTSINRNVCRRKKSVIVLKNGKNIFQKEMENLVNKIVGVKGSFIFEKQQSKIKKIYVKS